MGLTRLQAAVFDMDGLLVESESCWRQAEQEASDRLGLGFGPSDFEATMGMRMRDVAQTWFDRRPWRGPSPAEVADQVVDRVAELVAGAVPLPGVREAMATARDLGLRLALCSSSDRRLIDATLAALGLDGDFEVVHSATDDEFGKPHPQPYLSTAAALGVDPGCCVVFEDSLNGAVAARAAAMAVIAVPAAGERGSGRFGFCDVTLDSLEQCSPEVLRAVDGRSPQPQISRPRFHLAFPVDDLARARWFYGRILGCPEGRSAAQWVDFDLWGHQVVAHLDPVGAATPHRNEVDGHAVPVRHFGLLLDVGTWRTIVDRLRGAEVPFVIDPHVRFAGEPGEQHTCFVLDPAGNALEFKAFADDRAVFAAGPSVPDRSR